MSTLSFKGDKHQNNSITFFPHYKINNKSKSTAPKDISVSVSPGSPHISPGSVSNAPTV